MRTAKIEKEAFIKLCTKIAAEEKVEVELLPFTRFGEEFVILRDKKTNTGIARWCFKKTVRLAKYRTERGYSSWMNEIEGNRQVLTDEIRAAFSWETTPFKYETFPKFEDECPRVDLVSFEEILEFFKKNKIEPAPDTIADNIIDNNELVVPYGCYSSMFANWGASKEMTAPYPCQKLWSIPESWGKARNSIIGFDGIGRDYAEKSGVPQLAEAYGWGWEHKIGNSRWTEQMYKRHFKCFFFRPFVKQVYGVEYWSEEGKKIWIVDSLEDVQKLWDKAIELGYDYNVKQEA